MAETELRHAEWLTDLAGGELAGDELRAALAARYDSAEEVAAAVAEIEAARRVRRLMLRLQAAEVEVPEGFEARLLERVRGDRTLLDMLELYLNGFGSALVELLNMLFSFFPLDERPQSDAA